MESLPDEKAALQNEKSGIELAFKNCRGCQPFDF
jgi:hypothetical protein